MKDYPLHTRYCSIVHCHISINTYVQVRSVRSSVCQICHPGPATDLDINTTQFFRKTFLEQDKSSDIEQQPPFGDRK